MEILIPIAVIAGLALLLGVGLSIASKVFHVARDPRIDTVREALPGANCGACGYSGCDGYAEAIATGEAGITLCPVGGAPLVVSLGGIMGIEAEETVGNQAVVLCQGDWKTVDMKYKYEGIQDCASAAALLGGMSACIFGCLGLGSCQRVCKFDAIVVENGLARILPTNARAAAPVWRNAPRASSRCCRSTPNTRCCAPTTSAARCPARTAGPPASRAACVSGTVRSMPSRWKTAGGHRSRPLHRLRQMRRGLPATHHPGGAGRPVARQGRVRSLKIHPVGGDVVTDQRGLCA
jgi:RnfABCDGE-type electron transport complex B subunit